MNKVAKLTTTDAARIDREIRTLVTALSSARIRVGLEVGQRLHEIEINKLYLKLDEEAYPSFPKYLESLGMKYTTSMELLGLYRTYVLTAGFDIDYLAEIPYHKLTVIKPKIFKKELGEYKMNVSMTEAKKWIGDAKSDISIEDLKQKRAEVDAGEHEHDWIHIRQCKICRLREYN